MTKVLIVFSSAATTVTGKEAGWYLSEAAQAYYSFVQAGFHVDFVSPEGPDPPVSQKSVANRRYDEGVKFLQDQDVVEKLKKCKKISGVDSSEYDAVYYVGGYGPVVDLAKDTQNADLVSAFWQSGKIVSAVCHGPAGLVHAKDSNGKSIFEGRRVTCLSNAEEKAHLEDIGFYLEDKVQELGGKFEKADELYQSHVVVDGQLYTGQNPASAKSLAERIVQDLKK